MPDPAPRLTLRLLGAPEVRVAGRPLALRYQKARALLYYLAATGQPHTRDHLATLLWSESPGRDARHSLRTSLYRLRQALRAGGAARAIVVDHDLLSLRLAADLDDCDVARFRRLVADGGDQALTGAIALHRGPLLQGFTLGDAPLFEEWLRVEEARLNRACIDVLERLAARAESRQAWDDALGHVHRIVEMDPLAEEAQRRLMELYQRKGATRQALRQYYQFEARLRQELSLAPSPDTQALFQTILQQQRRAAPSADPGAHPAARIPPRLPFVGRDDLLRQLLAISQHPLAGRGATVLLQGEGGIGKSRLLDELAARLSAGAPPWIVLQGACSPFDDLLSYGPFLEALQSAVSNNLADLLASPGNTAPDARGRFFWRVLQTLRGLARNAPLLLAVDDLQWASSSTLNLFGFLAMRLRSLPVMLVGTAQRVEAIPALQRLVTLGRRRGELQLLSLTPLSADAITALLRASGVNPDSTATLAGWIHERSGGSPFIVAEILAQLRAEAILHQVGHDWQIDTGRWLRWRTTFSLPETTHDLVAWRLANLAPDTRRLLDVLAVAGQPLPVGLLRELSSLEADELLSVVDDLTARALVVEAAEPGGALALPHHLLRETLLHRLSQVRRRALHRQLAEALEGVPGATHRQIALHAVAGEDVDRAQRYGMQVLADAGQDYAGAETVGFLHHLYDLLGPTASGEEMLRLTRALGNLHQSLGHLDVAAQWHRRNLEIARQAGGPSAQASAYFEMGELALVSNDYHTAAAAAQSGLAACGSPASTTGAALAGRGLRLLGAALAMEGSDLPAAESNLLQAVAAQRLADNQGDLCATLFELGNVAAQRGELERALAFYDEAAAAAEAGHVPYYLALARNNFAYHSLLLGRPDSARQAAAEGLKLAEAHEMVGVLLFLCSTAGEIHLYLGEWAEAAESFGRGLSLAEELGNLERQAGYRAGLALAARGRGGDLQEAAALLEEALALVAGQGYWHLQTRLLLWLAETFLLDNRPAEARPRLDEALATARLHGRALLRVQAERLNAQLVACGGDLDRANALFSQALAQASGIGVPLEIARTKAAWGQTLLRQSPASGQGRTLVAEARATLAAHDARAELAALTSA